MSALTDFIEQGLRDHFKSDSRLSLEDTYLALLTADPTDTGSTVSEFSGGWYARKQIYQATATTPHWIDYASGQGIENGQQITFPAATASEGTMTYVGVMDAATGGNMLLKTALTTARQVKTNDTVRFSAGELVFHFGVALDPFVLRADGAEQDLTIAAGGSVTFSIPTPAGDADQAPVVEIASSGDDPENGILYATLDSGNGWSQSVQFDMAGTYIMSAYKEDTSSGATRDASNEITVTVDDTAPPAVSDLSASGGDSQVDLTWTISDPTDNDLAKEEIHRSTTSGFTPTLGGATLVATQSSPTEGGSGSYTDDGTGNLSAPSNGTTYYYKILSVDDVDNYNESNEASATPASAGLTVRHGGYDFSTQPADGNAYTDTVANGTRVTQLDLTVEDAGSELSAVTVGGKDGTRISGAGEIFSASTGIIPDATSFEIYAEFSFPSPSNDNLNWFLHHADIGGPNGFALQDFQWNAGSPTIDVQVYTTSGGYWLMDNVSFPVSAGTLHTLTVKYDQPNAQVEFLVDGVQQDIIGRTTGSGDFGDTTSRNMFLLSKNNTSSMDRDIFDLEIRY